MRVVLNSSFPPLTFVRAKATGAAGWRSKRLRGATVVGARGEQHVRAESPLTRVKRQQSKRSLRDDRFEPLTVLQ